MPVFYDHVMNLTSPADASATARVRRDAIASGDDYRVDFVDCKGVACFWNGGRYDAIQLAKQLHFNNREVTLTAPGGRVVDIKSATY